MCSSVFGPAMPPPLVTCPTTNTAVPLSLAKRMRRAAHSRTWPTLPGAPSRSRGEHRLDRVDDQHGRRALPPRWRGPSREFVSLSSVDVAGVLAEPVGAQLDLERRSPRRRRRARSGRALCSRAATWSSSVDLPMPGSPPTSTIEPGHDAAAEHEVELVDARLPAPRFGAAHVAQPRRRPRRCRPRRACACRRRAALAPPVAHGFGAAISSTSVFHSPHTSQRPAHLGWSAPHSVQR